MGWGGCFGAFCGLMILWNLADLGVFGVLSVLVGW